MLKKNKNTILYEFTADSYKIIKKNNIHLKF